MFLKKYRNNACAPGLPHKSKMIKGSLEIFIATTHIIIHTAIFFLLL